VDRPEQTTGGGAHGPLVGRALAVVVVAVVLGVLALRATPQRASTLPPSTVTTTVPRVVPTTTTTVPHRDVKVLVANASTTNQVAAGYSTVLQQAGWTVLAPVTAKPPPRATSSVYYASGRRDEALAVAAAFGLPASAVLPLSSATPVSNVDGADVVLVVGSDLAAKTPPSTVPPTTTTSPTTTRRSTAG